MAYLHPGVFVEEEEGGARPIEGVGTSTAGFIGIAEKGPTDKAVRITSWSQYNSSFGSFMPDSDLAYSVFGFFANGGTACYITRVNHGNANFADTKLSTVEGNDSLALKAVSPGIWGNNLKVEISDGNNDQYEEFNLTIFDGDDAVETFEDLSMTDSALNYVGKMINDISETITVDDIAGADYAVYMSTKNLATPNEVDLVEVTNVKIQIDNESVEINLADGAADTANVTASHIADKINTAFLPKLGVNVASTVTEGSNIFIKIVSPTSGPNSLIKFLPPVAPDATEDVFGLVEYGWEILGEDKEDTYVEARGEIVLPVAAGTGPTLAGDELHISVDEAVPVSITLPANGDLESIIPAINGALTSNIAITDGKYLILRSDEMKSINLSGSAMTKLFGSVNDFYGYVTEATSDAAIILSVDNAASLVTATSKFMRIKLDSQPVIQIDLGEGHDFSSAITLEVIKENINSQVKSKTSIRKNVASVDGTKLKITSPTTGSNSKVGFYHARDESSELVSNDPVYLLFPDVLTKQLFLSDKYKSKAATVTGSINMDDGANLAAVEGSQLRIAVEGISSGDSKTINFVLADLTNVYELVGKINSAIDVRDFARIENATVGRNIKLTSPNKGHTAYIRLSMPQLTETGIHVSNLAQKNALPLLFGTSISGSSESKRDYSFVFGPGIRRPASNSELARLSGGSQDHGNVNNSDISGSIQIKDRDGNSINAGIRLFDIIDDVNLLSIPCVPPLASNVDHNALIVAGMSYCSNRQNCFYIADIPQDKRTPTDAQKFVRDELTASAGRDYAALYYPWISMVDPIGTIFKNRNIPPSGHIAGLYARIDGSRGVWKAPAGTEAGLAATNSLVKKIIDLEQDILNPIGLNCIRQFPGTGIVSWGARTLGVKTKPPWKYVPVRRTSIMMRESIYNGIQWAVFEPNNAQLWSALRLNISAFMNGLFRAGAFQGEKSSDAYFVRCGLGDTMTQADIDRGQVIVLVGFAPLKPAEFVIVRIQQKVDQQQ